MQKRVEDHLYSCGKPGLIRNPRTDRCVLRSGLVGKALVDGLDALKRGQTPRASGNKLGDAAVRALQREWSVARQYNNANSRAVAKLTASSAVSGAIARNLENKLRRKANRVLECGAMFDRLAAEYERTKARLENAQARVRDLERAVLNSSGFMYGAEQ
jgi:hypothetical protein